MVWTQKGSLYIDDRFSESTGFLQFTTGRSEGNIKDISVRRRLMERMPVRGWACGEQVHGVGIEVIDEPYEGERCFLKVDGIATGLPSIALGVFTADCVPVMYADRKKKAVAVVHAGWRGVHGGLPGAMAECLTCRFGSHPEDILVSIGPHIRSCCYAVGRELGEYFTLTDRGTVDLKQAVMAQLHAKGIPAGNISSAPWCTSDERDKFFSYRAEQRIPDRMFSVIGMV